VAGPKKKGQIASGAYAQGTKLFEKLEVGKLLTFLERLYPQQVFTRRNATTIRTACLHPGHRESTPSFDIDVGRGFAKCYGCGYHSNNVFGFFRDIKGWPYNETATKLQSHLGARIVSDKAERDLENTDTIHEARRVLAHVTSEVLQRLLTYWKQPETSGDYTEAFINGASTTLKWLFEERKHKPEHASRLPYGIMPPPEMLLRLADLYLNEKATREYEDGATFYSKPRRDKILTALREMVSSLDTSYTFSVIYHTGHSLTVPGRFRLRKYPFNPKSECMIVLPGMDETESVGFVGLYMPALGAFTRMELLGDLVLCVEGEHDYITLAESLFEHNIAGIWPIALCGNANEIDDLYEAGIKEIHLLSDEPIEGRGETFLRERLQTAQHVLVRPFVKWSEFGIGAKDPDEAIQRFGFEKVKQVVIDNVGTSFIPADQWALGRLLEEVEAISPTEVNARMSKAIEYGRCVRNATQLANFIEEASQRLKLPAGPMRQEIVKAKHTELGFIARIVDILRREFQVLYKEDNGRGGLLRLFHKKTQRRLEFYMTDGEAMIAQLANVFGNMYVFFRDQVGLPPSYAEDLPNASSIKEALKEIQIYLKIAMQEVYQGVPSRAECKEIGQGMEFVDIGNSRREMVLLNGREGIVCHWTEDGRIVPEKLQAPVYGNYLLNTVEDKWSTDNITEENILAANEITLEQVGNTIDWFKDVLNDFWRFQHQREDTEYLAYRLVSMAATVAFPAKGILNIIGEWGSGKSSLHSGFGGRQNPDFTMLEMAKTAASYTSASINQGWHRCNLIMALDEFTAIQEEHSHKGMHVLNITEMIRNVNLETGAISLRGTADGTVREYSVHTDIVLAGILQTPDPQDQSRKYDITTMKDAGLADPIASVIAKYGKATLAFHRRIFTLGLLRHLPRLRELYDEVKIELNQEKFADFTVPSRFLRHFTQIVCVMKLLGRDWKDLIVRCVATRKHMLQAQNYDTIPNNLFNKLLRVPGINLGADGRTSIQGLLVKPDGWKIINAAHCGVFFHHEKKYAVVDWTIVKAPGGLLHHVEGVEGNKESVLKHSLDQHACAIRERDYEKHGIHEFLRANRHYATAGTLSVVKLDAVVADLGASTLPSNSEQPGMYPASSTGTASTQTATTQGQSSVFYSQHPPASGKSSNNI